MRNIALENEMCYINTECGEMAKIQSIMFAEIN